ncbi:NACHT domain-containing protein [Methylobacterium sp. Leaf99]|uniref:NACHT domain-containing protein n=1 Tax=Methylobacterium sp. Leaf99 TaxID=1736251 RepID=UPI0009E97FCF|nr:hypothetical protein [Methylobacterium sp. Leaf99]
MSRDEFSEKTKLQVAKATGFLCSFPGCRVITVGATEDGQGIINIGTAAHICAAASGGPRYDVKMSPDERSAASNAIWLCRDHGKAIDSDVKAFPTGLLREWKRQAEQEAWRQVTRSGAAQSPRPPAAPLFSRIRTAAAENLKNYCATDKWPATRVALMVKVEGLPEPLTTTALADAGTALQDLVLVAPPGMGKTTTIFQIAEGVLANGNGIPLIVHLGDWATGNATVLGSILRRAAFRGISEDEIREVARQPGVVLLLDGWNELDLGASARVRVEIENLKAELPQLGLIVSTRRQALDVPFRGAHLELQPLNEEQQMQIATDMRGEAGAELVDHAWRTPGVRELVSIPLYLTALLSLPEGVPFPTTKEEVLRHFVGAHEKVPRNAEALRGVADGLQRKYLDGLAVFAIRTANTTITEGNAQVSVSGTATLLVENGLITIRPKPNAILDVLVGNHLLTRERDAGFSFQHQQLQEWYASHSVEGRVLAELDDPKARETLKAEIFDMPVWEESILFAVERLARGSALQNVACGKAILAAFEADPMLAAEMIAHATDEVWVQIGPTIQVLVGQWHATGKVDRAFRFMLTSGRSEFLPWIWPLVTDRNHQVSLKALRSCERFRPSILGNDVEAKIRALDHDPRKVLLHEMASHGGLDGLDLASAIAKGDPDPDVQATVIEAMAFRRADRHVAEVLSDASEATFDLVAGRGLIDEVQDLAVRQGVAAARQRIAPNESPYDCLSRFAHGPVDAARANELTRIISTIEIDGRHNSAVSLIYKARERYPDAVAAGLLARTRAGLPIFFGTDDLLAASGLVLDDDALVEIVLMNPEGRDGRSEAAASVLGPVSAGRLIEDFLALAPRERTDRTASEACSKLRSLIAHVPGASLAAAAAARSSTLNNKQIALVADVLGRGRDDEDSDRGRPFDPQAIATVQGLVEDWGNRLLAASDVRRWDRAEVVRLAGLVPSPAMLPLLGRMLDDELAQYREFWRQAEAEGWLGNAADEARTLYTHQFQRAFMAIRSPETTAMMREYLADEHFGEFAAGVLAGQWRQVNEPQPKKATFGRDEFADVAAKRATRAGNPKGTCDAAETIFVVIDQLLADDATEEQRKLALLLGSVACRLPHGRRDGTISKLVAVAPRRARAGLLAALASSGVTLDARVVAAGIRETIEAAQQERWILDNDAYELRAWTRILPFINRLSEVPGIIRELAPVQRNRQLLEEIIRGLGLVGSRDAEELLFELAVEDPHLYEDYNWRSTVMRFGTPTSARRLFDLAAGGLLSGRSSDSWQLSRGLSELMAGDADMRRHVYNCLLKGGPAMPGFLVLTGAVAEDPDEEGLLLLVRFEQETDGSLVGWRTIESVVTDRVPANGYGQNVYNIVPKPVAELRSKLLAMTTDGGPSDHAARHLNYIDSARDEHGRPETEPRHPDLASVKPWPIMRPDPNARAD